jgi:hypothetical protein
LTTDGDSCGIAWLDVTRSGQTLGVVAYGCATGYYSTGHEIGHMYGCYHNVEVSGANPIYPTANGFLINPPVNSGLRTILGYALFISNNNKFQDIQLLLLIKGLVILC